MYIRTSASKYCHYYSTILYRYKLYCSGTSKYLPLTCESPKYMGANLEDSTVEKPILLAGTHLKANQRGEDFRRSPNGPTTGLHII